MISPGWNGEQMEKCGTVWVQEKSVVKSVELVAALGSFLHQVMYDTLVYCSNQYWNSPRLPDRSSAYIHLCVDQQFQFLGTFTTSVV